MRLILGPGSRHQKLPGDFLIDRLPFPGVDCVHDLDVHPWPLSDASCDSVVAVHVVEHLRSLLIPFMNEGWRVLRPGGSLYLETPLAGGNPDLEFCDPTHIRCYRIHSFVNYFSPEGVVRFGYTDRAWNFFTLKVKGPECGVEQGVLVVHAYPIKAQ